MVASGNKRLFGAQGVWRPRHLPDFLIAQAVPYAGPTPSDELLTEADWARILDPTVPWILEREEGVVIRDDVADLKLIKSKGAEGATPADFEKLRSRVRTQNPCAPRKRWEPSSTNDIRAWLNRVLEGIGLPFRLFHTNLIDFDAPIRMYRMKPADTQTAAA